MRILHVINSFEIGGAETQLLLTLPLLQREDYWHSVSALRPPKTLQSSFEAQGFSTYLLLPRKIHPLGQFVEGTFHLLRLVRKVRPDILHTVLFPANIITRLVGRFTKTPVVEHWVNILYDPLWLKDPQFTPRKLQTQFLFDRMTIKWVNHFIAISEAVKKSALERFKIPSESVTVIPYGVFPEEWERPKEIQPEEALLVTTGRLVGQKGHQYLLRSLTEVVPHYPQARLLLIGDGPLRSELESLCERLGIQRHVVFRGRIKPQEVKNYLWRASLFVFPSLSEGLGVALIEAMASGLPVVASAIDVVREILAGAEAGLLVPPENASALAQALCILLGDSRKREEMGWKAQELVQERYNLRRLAPQWLEVYRRLETLRVR